MMEEYKKEVEGQHAPEQLIQDTLKRSRKDRHFPVTWVAAAAGILIVAAAGFLIQDRLSKGSTEIQFAQIEETGTDGGLRFGTKDLKRSIESVETSKGDTVTLNVYENPKFDTEQYQQGEAVTVQGVDIYFSEDQTSYFAYGEISGTHYLIEAEKSEKIDKEEFAELINKIEGVLE